MKLKQDLTNTRTRVRQRQMMLALRRADLGSCIEQELPEIRLHPAFCQWEARDRRKKLHKRAKRLFEGVTPSETLSFVTWIVSEPRHPTSLTLIDTKDILDRFAVAIRSLGATAIAASTEVDFDVSLGVWQLSVHGIIRRPLGLDRKKFSAKLKSVLKVSADNTGAYRPVVVKSVTDLDGLISYVFKSLALLSITQRATWRTPDGKPRSRKQALRTPQLRQLLNQSLAGCISSQLLITFANEVAR